MVKCLARKSFLGSVMKSVILGFGLDLQCADDTNRPTEPNNWEFDRCITFHSDSNSVAFITTKLAYC